MGKYFPPPPIDFLEQRGNLGDLFRLSQQDKKVILKKLYFRIRVVD